MFGLSYVNFWLHVFLHTSLFHGLLEKIWLEFIYLEEGGICVSVVI